MTMTLNVHQTFPGSLDQVRAMLTDPDYARTVSYTHLTLPTICSV